MRQISMLEVQYVSGGVQCDNPVKGIMFGMVGGAVLMSLPFYYAYTYLEEKAERPLPVVKFAITAISAPFAIAGGLIGAPVGLAVGTYGMFMW